MKRDVGRPPELALQEGPLRDLHELLDLVRAKFDVGSHRLGLAARLLLAREIQELPEMIRLVSKTDITAFCERLSRALVRSK